MACIATVFGSGLGGRVSVSDRKDDVESCTSFRQGPPQTNLHTIIFHYSEKNLIITVIFLLFFVIITPTSPCSPVISSR